MAVEFRKTTDEDEVVDALDSTGHALAHAPVHWYEERLYSGPGPPGTSPRYFVVFELDGVPEGFATYRLRDQWDDGVPNGAVFVVRARSGGICSASIFASASSATSSIPRSRCTSVSPTRGGCA